MKILFLTARFCYPLLKGDASRVYHQLRALGRDHQITLLCTADHPVSQADYREIEALCERVVVAHISRKRVLWNLGRGLFSRAPLQVNYYSSPALHRCLAELLATGEFDLVHVTLARMLPYVWHLRETPVVVDLIDSLSLNLETRRHRVRGPKRLGYELEYRRMLKYERQAVSRFPALLVTSQADAVALGGGNKVKVLPMGVDIERFPFRASNGRDPATLVFTGNMRYHPNEEAALWFAAEVWPRVRTRHPEARWQIVGANPTERVRALASAGKGIEVTGWVPDMNSYLGQATLAVCPLRSGSGIQMKVQEAMSTGTPVVATSIANRGVGGIPGCHLLVSDTADGFAQAIAMLIEDPDCRTRMGTAGRAFAEQHFSWRQHAEQLSAIYASLVGSRE